jgi:hypothetical protein
MKFKKKFLSVGALALLGFVQPSQADNFSTTVTIGGITRTLSFANFDAAINAANNPDQYQGLFPGVSSTVGAVATLDFKGVPIEFSKLSTTDVVVKFPTLGVTQNIVITPAAGASASAVTKQLNTQVENVVRSYNAAINKQLAIVDPADPLGGNPSSVMGIMVENAYLLGMTDDFSSAGKKAAATENLIGGGLRYGHYSLSGKSVDTFTAPFSYTAKLTDRQQLIFSLPFSYIDTQGAKSYDVGAGVGYKVRVTDNWVLTPAVAYGFRGSFDLADVGHIASGTVTSKYTFDLDSFDPNSIKLSIGNMAGYYTTLPYEVNGFSVDPNLQNYIIKNGLILSKDLPGVFFGDDLNVAANFTDTEYFGSKLFVDQYNELGLTFKAVNDQNWISNLAFNANYLFSATSKNVEGFRVGLNYQF